MKPPRHRTATPNSPANREEPRFIILASEFPPEKYGGIAHWAKNLLDTLTANGYGAIVLTHLSRAHKKVRVVSTAQVRYIRGRDWKKLHWLYRLPSLIGELINHRNCVIIAATWDELQLIHYLKPVFNFRVYCSSHGTDITRHLFPKKKRMLRRINHILGSVDLFLPVSHSLDRLARDMHPDLTCNSIVLGCNVDTITFRPENDPQKKAALKLQLGLDGETPLIITVGRMTAVKGFRHVIMALPAILEKFPKTRYMIVARPQEPENFLIEHLVRELGLEKQVIIQPPVANEELPILMQAADIFTLTSEPVYFPHYQEEGLPRVIPEANACGLPVIVSTTGGLAEAVVDGQTGFIVADGDQETLKKRILTLLENHELAVEMGRKGRDLVIQHFSAEAMTSKILAIARK